MDILKLMWALKIIFVGEVIFLILSALYRVDLIELKTLVTLAVLEIVGGGFSYYLIMLRINHEKKEKKEKKKLDHSKLLIDKELKFRTNTYIDFSDDDNLELCIKETPIDTQTHENYSNEINTHLEKGYSEVWKHKTECDSIINNHNNLAKLFLDATKEEIIKKIEKRNLSLIEWNGKGQSPRKYFIPEYLFLDVEYIIHNSYFQYFNIEKYCAIEQSDISLNSKTNEDILTATIVEQYPEHFEWKLTINHKFAESDFNDIKELKQIIKAILNVALTKDDFNKLKKYKKDADMEHGLFKSGITEIIKNVDNDIPLNHECRICENY